MARIAFLPHHIPLIKFRKKALLRCMLLSTLSDWGIVCVLVVGRWVFAWQIVASYSRGSVEVCVRFVVGIDGRQRWRRV